MKDRIYGFLPLLVELLPGASKVFVESLEHVKDEGREVREALNNGYIVEHSTSVTHLSESLLLSGVFLVLRAPIEYGAMGVIRSAKKEEIDATET